MDHGQTGICPLCHIDSLLPSTCGFPVTQPRFLRKMYERWFRAPQEAPQVETSEVDNNATGSVDDPTFAQETRDATNGSDDAGVAGGSDGQCG